MQSKRFADLMQDFVPDMAAARHDLRSIAPADRCYVILFSARSGSSWLTSLLAATGLLGDPREYINPNFVASRAREYNVTKPRHLLRMLKRRCKSPNGVFGLEARAFDIQLLSTEAFTHALADDAVFFHLWRTNVVAQAVSLYRAVATGHYHATGPAAPVAPPPYDALQIENWLNHIVVTENENASMLHRLGVAARHLRYEEMVADRAGTLRRFARVLGQNLPEAAYAAPAGSELSKIGDAWNIAAEARFRQSHAEMIASVTAQRAVLHGTPGDRRPESVPEDDAAGVWLAGRRAGGDGDSPFDLPPAADRRTWLDGWRAGWNDQLVRPAPAATADLPEAALPAELAEAPLRRLRQATPRAMHDYAALRLGELLAEQHRVNVVGGLLEIGLSRGRQTALLIAAPRDAQTRVIGLDLLDGSLIALLRPLLAEQLGEAAMSWRANTATDAVLQPAPLQQMLGGSARFVSVDAAQAPGRIDALLALADAVVGDGGCVSVSDMLSSLALSVTEAVLRFLATHPRIAPFAVLPGRLLLAPRPVHTLYLEMMTALALRDRSSAISLRMQDAASRGDSGRIEQTLAGWRVLALA